MSQAQSLRKKNSADSSTQPLQRSGTKNNSGALDKKAASAAQQDNAPLQKKAYRSALSSGQSSAQDEPRLQTKLSVSTPGDSHEQEADRVADEVVSRSAAAQSTEENKLSPGSTKPENNASNPQSLQTKISRMAEPAPAAIEASETESSSAETATDSEQGVSAEIEQQIAGLRGQGEQLPEHVRTEMESQFNHDFSSVSIHNDSTADALCKQLSARAFTVGSDIFFASSEYAPDSQEGKRLLAHELTHVVQQGRGVTRKIMRDEVTPAALPYTISSGDLRGTSINPTSSPRTLVIPKISLPRFKRRNADRYTPPITLAGRRPPTQQLENWRALTSATAESQVHDLAEQARGLGGVNDSGQVFFQAERRRDFLLFGSEAELKPLFQIPIWDKRKEGRTFQVDHIKEMQMGGEDLVDGSNYELLDASANMSSGWRLGNPEDGGQIGLRIRQALRALKDAHPTVASSIPDPTDYQNVRYGYNVQFCDVDWNLPVNGNPDQFWSLPEVTGGEHAALLRPMNRRDMLRLGSEGSLVFFASPAGGERMPLPTPIPKAPWIGNRLDLVSWSPVETIGPAGSVAGTLRVNAFKSSSGRLRDRGVHVDPEYENQDWIVKRIDGIHGGYIDRASVDAGMRMSLRLPGMSPISLETVELNGSGIHADGRVLTTVPLIDQANIRIRIDGDNIEVYKTFAGPELRVPSPFEIKDTELTVFYGSERGLGIEGRVDFGISKVGEGFLGAAASTTNGFALEGQFNFDDRIFGEGTNAQVRMGYANDQWSMGGTITIPEGKVPGIRTATINVDYSQGAGFSATGTASLNVPGVESGTIEITHNEEEGFVIGGSFNLSQGRGIRGGQISARVQEKPGCTGYAVTAHGEAQPDIPGINSNLIVDYNDGAFTAEVSADYSRGMLSGRVNAGVTNRTVNDDGTLSDIAAEGNPLVVYGGGQLTLQIAPWLQGTAGVQFAPNGEVTVTGEIGLPSQLEIFARREINKSIFSIAVQAPIFPGIVAEVGGGLSATAGIGPGVIDQLRLGITYNPAHEEETRITGDAHLNIPANAGLRLSVRAGIGLGITGASATGGLDIGGTLGIEGAAEAGVHVEWTPATGLDIQTELAVHAQPSFTFDIGGYVSVRALGFEVYDNRWEFASYTFGSDYRFGIRLPIHYREGEPFEVSTDDIEFEVPDIDTEQLLSGLIERIA